MTAVAAEPDQAHDAASVDSIAGPRKAAMVLISLGEQVSSKILCQLSEEEVQRVSKEVAQIRSISSDQLEAVLEEFYNQTLATEYVVSGGIEYARKMLVTAFGPEAATRMMDKLPKDLNKASSFGSLQKVEPKQLARFLQSEHPQTIALILSHLDSSKSAALLMSLPEEMQTDIALRMAALDQIAPEIVTRIAAVVDEKLKALGDFSRESRGGVRSVAEMFNRLDSSVSEQLLAAMEQRDANTAGGIRHLMFVFEDFLQVDQNGIKEVLARVDRKVLTIALKGTSDALKNHFTSCMSQRGAEMLKEDMDAAGPVRIRDVEAAQKQVIEKVKELQAEGVINLKGGSDQYVV
ncbi:MAG TPA: flagellar motor switch protein FliG [Bryobacteraceae bacterium]|nr:flagellar motor switch protein FliG [Bryobacteraceae bacterium]